jgi:hypothetical protein
MPSQLPVFSRVHGDPSIASYEWVDLNTGFGYRTFYCIGSRYSQANTETFFLSPRQMDSSTFNNKKVGSFDIDFDTTIKVPCIIGGADAYVEYSYWTLNITYQVDITVYHVTAGGVETSLGTVQNTNDSGDASTYMRHGQKIALTQKKFAIGEKLRVNVIANASSGSPIFYYDGIKTLTDDDSRTVGTDMNIQIPFKIDV